MKPIRGRVPCPSCQGTGMIDARFCRDTKADGKPCQQLARSMTDPDFMERYGLDPASYPPNFMEFCGRHGNTRQRQFEYRQRRARERTAVTPG